MLDEARRISGCEGKVGHATQAAAEKHLNNIRVKPRTGPRGLKVKPYLCSFCSKWHNGHSKGDAYRKGRK